MPVRNAGSARNPALRDRRWTAAADYRLDRCRGLPLVRAGTVRTAAGLRSHTQGCGPDHDGFASAHGRRATIAVQPAEAGTADFVKRSPADEWRAAASASR